MAESKPQREMKVLALGLLRTGTMSMAEALLTLGYHDVFHGIKAIENNEVWEILNRASDATFPVLPTYTGKPFTRQQWDELYGPFEASTDLAAVFAPELIKIYPEAKVILVVRDYDKWYNSISQGLLARLWGPVADFSVDFVEPVLGTVAGLAARKQMLGLFRARNLEECLANARETYDRHHRLIREMVPPGQLLEYRMGDGWGPLCEFLGKPVPGVEFPWVNEASQLRFVIFSKVTRNMLLAAKVLATWAGGAAAVGVGSWFMVKKTGYI